MANNGNGRQEPRLGPVLTDRTLIARGAQVWKVYVFLRRNGAFGNGHTAVGYQNNRDSFACGGIENYNQGIRAAQIGEGDRNDGWFLMSIGQSRMFSLMNQGAGPVTTERQHPDRAAISTARNQKDYTPWSTHVEMDDIEVGPYGETAEFCFTGSPDFNAADALLSNLPNRGYTLAGNNCNNAVADVLRAYGIPKLPWNQTNLKPKDWFDALPSSWTRTIG